jgi:uncharacterized lipoprotein YmbA
MVVILAELAGHHFKLIWDIPAFVSEETKQFVVHIALPEYLDEGGVVQGEEDTKLERFDLVLRPDL